MIINIDYLISNIYYITLSINNNVKKKVVNNKIE